MIMVMVAIAMMKMLIALTSQRLERFIKFYFFKKVGAESTGMRAEGQEFEAQRPRKAKTHQ